MPTPQPAETNSQAVEKNSVSAITFQRAPYSEKAAAGCFRANSKPFDVIVEVGQENIFSKFSKRNAGVARQPVFYDVLFYLSFSLVSLEARKSVARSN
jgi:hypothetical protein